MDPNPPGLSQVSRYFSLFLALSFFSFFSLSADFSISQQMHLSPGGWGVGREGTRWISLQFSHLRGSKILLQDP